MQAAAVGAEQEGVIERDEQEAEREGDVQQEEDRDRQRETEHDAAREARYHGIPFGRIADPVGRPVERGYALIPWARAEGCGTDYVLAFLDGVWARGIDAGSDRGLRQIVERAGLSWALGRKELSNPGWRTEAASNARELSSLGLWGVPCFRVGDQVTWGQDRLWFVEEALLDAASRASPSGGSALR